MISDIRPIAPKPDDHWALFLDIDGTLLDIAPTPDTVVVPDTLIPTLLVARARLGGALAIISGRPLSDIGRLLGPAGLPGAAEHGAIIRLGDGTIADADPAAAVPLAWQSEIAGATENWAGVIVERKRYSVAVHFRAAPEREAEIRSLVTALVAPAAAEFEVLSALCSLEIRHRSIHKGAAVRTLMQYHPFTGRVPVFVGDDVTDEDGIAAAAALGGFGLRVGEAFDGRPAKVRRWLEDFVAQE